MLKNIPSFAILLAVTCACAASYTANDEPCPTWFHHSEKGSCVCGDPVKGVVSCDNATQSVGVLDCFCMTSNGDKGNTTVVGRCIFNCFNYTDWTREDIYHPVYGNVSGLDDKTCGYLNCNGRLCSACKEGNSVSAYSYDLTCFQCTSSIGYNMIKYVSIAFLPLTLLYLLCVIFRVSATSPQLNTYVIMCQTYATPIYLRFLVQITKKEKTFPLVQTLATVYGIWNLDFFRTVIPPICLPLNTLQILALDYLVALYPLLLIIISYVLLNAYERGCRVIVWLWRPFHKILARFRRPWNLRHSIIDAFATFLLLSYTKLLTVSTDLLIPVDVRNIHGEWVGQYLYYDASIPVWEGEHLPYACCAVIILVVVVVFPIGLLVLYPMQCFQKCLNRCGCNCQALRIFMQCFQGCYRDRTDGGMECRYFAAVYPSIRLISFFLYSITCNEIVYSALAIMLIGVTITIIVVQPYKDMFKLYNKVDATMALLLALHVLGIIINNDSALKNPLAKLPFSYTGLALSAAVTLVPLVYISVILARLHFLCHYRVRAFRLLQKLTSQLFRIKHHHQSDSTEHLVGHDSSSLNVMEVQNVN